MKNQKAIAIFGGSFNPPLNSHFSLAQQIINECESVEKVIFVPVSSKYSKPGLLENTHRYNMLKLVCDKNKLFEVSDIELNQERQLRTIETLQLLQNEYPNNVLYFVIGTDNLKEISTWSSPEILLSNFKIIVLQRDEDDIEKIIDSDKLLKKYEKSFIKIEENINSNMSSTFVREKLKAGKDIRYLTPDEVYYYINENGLYS